jgi:dissimilatory sulfite reductase (desulfoviridin) alpha/beta subunit
MFVFGTRPEAIKMAPVIKEVEKYPDILEPVIVVTAKALTSEEKKRLSGRIQSLMQKVGWRGWRRRFLG